jgi:glycosyltransferase involved in cell wall biosynthesis
MLDFDVLFFQRVRTESFHKVIVPYLHKHGKKIILDIDDLLWHIPESNPAHLGYQGQSLVTLTENFKSVDLVTCSTIPLANYIKKHINPNVEVFPNILEDIKPFTPPKNKQLLTIGYAGSPSHSGDFDKELISYLKNLVLTKKAYIHFIGYCPKELITFSTYDSFVPLEKYPEVLLRAKFDIAIMPLKKDIFNTTKSNLKYLEMSDLSIPSIGSSVYPYEKTIIHNENGLLVVDDWKSNIELLLNSYQERIRLAQNAHSFVRDNFTFKYNFKEYLETWKRIFLTL